MKELINKFDFEVEELYQDVEGYKQFGVTTRYIRPSINVMVSVKGTDLEHEIEKYSFCSEIWTEKDNKVKEIKTVTEFYNEENEDISDQLKQDLIECMIRDYDLYETVCVYDNKISNILALYKDLGLENIGIEDIAESDGVIAQYNYLKLNHKFVSDLLDKEIITTEEYEEILNF